LLPVEQAGLFLLLFVESHCVFFQNLLACDVFWPALFLGDLKPA